MDNLAKQNKAPKTLEPEPPSSHTHVSGAMAKPMPYRKSTGDVIFDLGVYGGLGYIANAGISLVADRYGTQLPQAKLYKTGQSLERWFAKRYRSFMQDEENAKEWAHLSTQIGFLGAGGWLLLAPMKWLEDRKIGIIRGIDSALGTGPQNPEGVDAQIEALDTGPRQSVASLFFGRAFSYSATIAAALPFISNWTPVGKNFTLFLNDQLTPHIRESWKTPTVKIDGVIVPKLVQAIAFETILAGTASVLHYGSSKLLSHLGHHISSDQRPPKSAVPLIAPPPLVDVRRAPLMQVSDVQPQPRATEKAAGALIA